MAAPAPPQLALERGSSTLADQSSIGSKWLPSSSKDGSSVLHRDLVRLALARAQLLIGGVGGDAVEPAAEGGLALEGVDLPRRRPERVLRRLLGVLVRSR